MTFKDEESLTANSAGSLVTTGVKMTHVVMFSSGIGSWAAAKVVARDHGVDNTKLLFMDTQIEDEDNYRFLEEAAENVGAELVWLKEGRDVFQVFKDVKFMGNSRVDPCSRILKRETADKWIADNFTPETVRVYTGIDWTEAHRHERMAKRKLPWIYLAPLVDEAMTKGQMLKWAQDEGLTPPRMYDMGFQHANCFHPDTKFVTFSGLKTFRESEGQTVRVVGRGGQWREAVVSSFGEQPTYELRLTCNRREKVIVTTADHLWPVGRKAGRTDRDFVTTLDLRPGDRIVRMRAQLNGLVRPSAVGIMAGFTFGDGTACEPSSGQLTPARAFLCGGKDLDLLPYFAGCRVKDREDGVKVVCDLPRSWKAAPSMSESQSYLYGWLAGYFAADGSYKHDQAVLSSASLENLEIARDVCHRLGIVTWPIGDESRKGFGDEESLLYHMSLAVGTLREDFFLIAEHRKRFLSKPKKATADWRVESVVPTGLVEEVMCATVPDGHVFALEDSVLTHNCGGFCIKSGQAQFKKLWENFPERYLEYERKEQEVYDHIGSAHPFIRKTENGVMRYLSMREFRQQYLEPKVKIDEFDWGGCGCFVDQEEKA